MTTKRTKIRDMAELTTPTGAEYMPVVRNGSNYKLLLSALSEYINAGGSVSAALSALQDVNIANPQDGQSLVYDAANGEWVNAMVESGTEVYVDTEMSDTSENAVQNKVIKAYVDDLAVYAEEHYADASNFDSLAEVVASNEERIGQLDISKAGDFYVDPTTQLFMIFTTTEAKNAYINSGDKSGVLGEFALGGGGTSDVKYAISITGLQSKYSFTTSSEKMLITCGYESKVKYADSDEYVEYIEDAVFSVEQYKNGAFVNIGGGLVRYGNTFSLDVKPYMASENTLRITVSGIVSSSSMSASTTVTVTSMALLPFNFRWNTPFIEGDTYSLGGLKILGALPKTLTIKVTGTGYEKIYTATDYAELNIGTSTYEDLAYNFNGIEHPQNTGVYKVEMWLTGTINNEEVTSDVLTYNIMCVAAADKSTAQLVCVNNIADAVDNYAESMLFSYAAYGGSSKPNPTITLKVDDTTIATGSYEVDNALTVDYKYAFAVNTTSTDAKVTATVVYGNTVTITYPLNNESSFAPVAGYSFYLDAATRNNTEAGKRYIINEVDGSSIAATWTDMAWVDGMDGWTVDENGHKCLLVPAMSKAVVDYAPMNLGTFSVEMLYRVTNVADFEEDIITITSDAVQSWMGVKIKPTNVLLHSKSLFESDLTQGYNTKDEELVHLVIVVAQNYSNIGNIAMIYVNGVKKCAFEWYTGDTFQHTGNLILGNQTSDLYLYKMRVYPIGLSWPQVWQNYLSCIPDAALKTNVHRKEQSVLTDGAIDYNKVYGVYNTFVVELPEGASLPNKKTNPKNDAIDGTNLYINIVQDPTCSIQGDWLNVPLEGQGTTAMGYYRWNLRSKTSSTYGKFRITAKKNVASSMHSHKRGSTALFNDLNLAIVGENEAGGRVAVYQYPVYGFLKKPNEAAAGTYIYEPIGLYTIGPDKGDKSTFGYDDDTYDATLIHMEGTDHSPKVVGMDYPWSQVVVGTNKDGDAFIGAANAAGTGLAEEAWEIGKCGDKEEVSDMKAYLDTEFAPAYQLDYLCTPMIVGLPAGTTLPTDSAELETLRSTKLANGFTYGDCLLYIDGEYDTYYYNINTKTYEKDGFKAYELLSGYGFSADTLETYTTVDAKTAYIIECRKARYRALMGDYWHVRDNLFHACFLDLTGATDNEKKNSYPYKFGTLASGSRWRWRQDDLDTIFDVNNEGAAVKKYSILNTDKQDGDMIFKGNTSYHWRCVREYFADELKDMMYEILDKMVELSPYGTSSTEKLIGCIRHYYWDYAQDYFTGGAYNIDAKWTYEDAWALYKTDTTVNAVHPLRQLLGSHYEAEVAWVTLRMLFIASLYEYGSFRDYVDTADGQISFRQGGTFTFELTPAIDMRPTIITGQNSSYIRANGRLSAGESVRLTSTLGSGEDTMMYIQGANWLSDIGDLTGLKIGSTEKLFTATAKRIQRLKLGTEGTVVTDGIGGLNLGLCPCVTLVDARDLQSLGGNISLETLPRLREAYFGGTNATSITLPAGSKVTAFDLPSTLQRLSLTKLPLLTTSGLTYEDGLPNLTYLLMKENTHLDGYELMKSVVNAEGSQLTNISVEGINYTTGDSTDITFLKKLATDSKYQGIDDAGNATTDKPNLVGSVHIVGSASGKDIAAIEAVFGKLDVSADKYVNFIEFADENVLNVLLDNGVDTDSDGGITEEEAAAVTSIGAWFSYNTVITTFNELRYFTSLKTFPYRIFINCTSLKSIELPYGITSTGQDLVRDCTALERCIIPDTCTVITKEAFAGCSSLTEIGTDLSQILEIKYGAFRGCSNLNIALKCPNLNVLEHVSFSTSGITRIDNLGNVTAIPDGDNSASVFWGCTNLVYANLSKITSIGKNAFRWCSSLTECVLTPSIITNIGVLAFSGTSISFEELNLPNLTSLGQNAFYGVSIGKLDISGLTSLPAASSSTQNFGKKDVLTEVVLSDGLTSIPDNSFHSYSALTHFNGGAALTSIGQSAFYECSSLQGDLVFDNLTSIGGSAFRKTNISSFIAPKLTSIVTQTSTSPFYSCKSLKYVDFPSVKSVELNAFQECSSLEYIELPSIETLGSVVFRGCTSLKYIRLGSNITSIGQYQFGDTTAVTNLVTEYIICEAISPPSLGTSAWYNTNNCPIYVPDGMTTDAEGNEITIVDAYKNATNWSTYADRIKPLSEYTE